MIKVTIRHPAHVQPYATVWVRSPEEVDRVLSTVSPPMIATVEDEK